MTDSSTSTTPALERIYTWRRHLTDQTVVSASEVQDRLFDLYGDLEALPQLEKLKPWLSLTIQRDMFSAEELDRFLVELHDEIDVGSD
jgi:CRISPR/Cas system CSM-associated protein Csm2 small subunit